MTTNRLEAFSDGVLAIIITIMVLELEIPKGITLGSLKPIIPTFMTFVLSFIYLSIYWNNHHHLMHTTKHVNGVVLWANLHLLFWLSLFPFGTGYMGENHFEKIPVGVYGFVLFMASLAWLILVRVIKKNDHPGSKVHMAYKSNKRAYISVAAYLIAFFSAFFIPIISVIIFIGVAILWIVPAKAAENNL